MTAYPRMPTTFVPHGGGPWPILTLPPFDEDETTALSRHMMGIRHVPPSKPRAVLVVSAHWEASLITVNTGTAPSMLYDYSGFPDEAYALKWPAPGEPQLAERVHELLRKAGFDSMSNSARGFDHGVFIPLMLAYPEADIPVLQVSLKVGLDAREHMAIGRALSPLRDEGVHIIGSGNSFHNLKLLFTTSTSFRDEGEAFDNWINDTVRMKADQRADRLTGWTEAPAARLCHPREEHLIPLMVVVGAAGNDAGRVHWEGTMNGYKLSAHVFE